MLFTYSFRNQNLSGQKKTDARQYQLTVPRLMKNQMKKRKLIVILEQTKSIQRKRKIFSDPGGAPGTMYFILFKWRKGIRLQSALLVQYGGSPINDSASSISSSEVNSSSESQHKGRHRRFLMFILL